MNSLERALEEQKQSTQQEILRFTGLLGIALGGSRVVEVPTRKGFVYVRLRDNPNEVIQAFNNQVASSYNLPVIVERQGNKYVISGVDTTRYENNHNSYAPYLPRHGNTHSFDLESGGGGDIVWVYPRQFVPALVFPSGSLGGPNVIVSPYTLKKDNGTWMYVGNTGTPNITSYRPTNPTGAIMGLVYLDASDGNPYLLIGSGTVFPNSITGSSQIVSYIPQVTNPSRQIPLAAVRLITGTSVLSWNNIYDVRQFVHNQPTGTAGGGSITVQDEGVDKGAATVFNFIGDGIVASVAGGVATISGSAGGGGSINTGTLDARYLKLDASNDPITGHLMANAGLQINAKSTISTYPLNINQESPSAAPLYINHSISGAVVQDSTLLIFREATHGARFPLPAVDVYDSESPGTITSEVFSAKKNTATRVSVHPYATGTIVNYLWDTDRARPTGTIHTSWRVSGTQVSYLDVSGTFHSNGSPLIKEAPVGGQPYVRRSAGWDSPFNDSEDTGIPSPIGSSANGTSTYAARRDHVHDIANGNAVLGSAFSITGGAGTYQATGLSIVLPSAGTYKITGNIRGSLIGNAGTLWWLVCKLRNTTDAADITNSERLIVLTGTTGLRLENTAPVDVTVTVDGADTIEVYAARDGLTSPSWTRSNIESASSGRSTLMYEKIG